MLAFWTARPRGETRQDLRQLLAVISPWSKGGVKRYFELLGIDDDDPQRKEMESAVMETAGMSNEERIAHMLGVDVDSLNVEGS